MSYFDDPANDATAYETEMQDRFAPLATMSDAHAEWHLNSGVPMGQPGCPQDACHPVDDPANDATAYGPLAPWERELLTGNRYQEGEGCVTFTRTDGTTVVLDNVRVDSISPGAENFGVIGVEYYDNDTVVHVPFVKFWTISYE